MPTTNTHAQGRTDSFPLPSTVPGLPSPRTPPHKCKAAVVAARTCSDRRRSSYKYRTSRRGPCQECAWRALAEVRASPTVKKLPWNRACLHAPISAARASIRRRNRHTDSINPADNSRSPKRLPNNQRLSIHYHVMPA